MPLSPGPMGKPTFSRGPSTGVFRPLASWTVATPSPWIRASVESRPMWTQPWCGPRMIRSTFSKDPNIGSLTLTGHHQLSPVTLDQYPTGRESLQILTPPCDTVTVEPTSSKMEDIIALTTQRNERTILPTQPFPVPQAPGGLDAPQKISPFLQQPGTVVGLGQTLLKCCSGEDGESSVLYSACCKNILVVQIYLWCKNILNSELFNYRAVYIFL